MSDPEISTTAPEQGPKIPASVKLLGGGALVGAGLLIAGVTHLGEGVIAFTAAPAVGEGFEYLAGHSPFRHP
ncbi:MAG TPA: hypothetical protein VNG32_03100 [Candidatus Dormibacteraeota bacterium]|nr:hypothetical protein [Candidatus Dormibacteraeota bacterium]